MAVLVVKMACRWSCDHCRHPMVIVGPASVDIAEAVQHHLRLNHGLEMSLSRIIPFLEVRDEVTLTVPELE